MCGIGGLLLHADRIPDRELLRATAEAMRYRGPDDEGSFVAQHIALVHRRLSIRDLSPAGRCPMASTDGRVQVVFNGEIYNWRELRKELEDRGVHFSSKSDTEVILHGYRAWGDRIIPLLRGMFALAIWDADERRLLLARDRAGEKPLYYQVNHDGLAFASTLEALKLTQQVRRIDPVALACHLVHGFIPSSHTVWEGIQVVPPAHALSITVGAQPIVYRFWDFPHVGPSRKSWRYCLAEVESVLDDSVARCLDADVRVGVFLSGGVDSSLVTALAARHQRNISAFSIGFAEDAYSELPHARRVAEHLGVTHHTREVGVDDVLACLPHLVVQYGQPFGDASAVPTYLAACLAHQHVKVCLSGDGADESFGGYWRMQAGVYAARYGAMLPRRVREQWVPLVTSQLGVFGKRWAAMNQLSLAPSGGGYTNSESWLENLSELAGSRLIPGMNTDLVSLRVGRGLSRPEASVVQRLLYDDFQVQLPDAYLTKVDVASMAASLEVRSPFLDQNVIELAWRLPDSMKLHWGQRKWLLKRIAARWVPPESVFRQKMGFAMPLPQWFRGKLGNTLHQLLEESVAVNDGWVKAEPVRRLLQKHREGENHATRLWDILWLELWFRLALRGDARESLAGFGFRP